MKIYSSIADTHSFYEVLVGKGKGVAFQWYNEGDFTYESKPTPSAYQVQPRTTGIHEAESWELRTIIVAVFNAKRLIQYSD